MISTVKQFFNRFLASNAADTPDPAHKVQVATAVLLIEMMRADFQQLPEEEQVVRLMLQRDLQLTPDEAQYLFNLAANQIDDAACLHEFTRLINESFSQKQKITIVELLWRVALADMGLDKYEEHLVRKIADLLYVRHKDFIKAKHRVTSDLNGNHQGSGKSRDR